MEWYILEDNLRVPSGASYPMIARELCRRSSPLTFQTNKLEDNRNYASLLRRTMDHVNVGGHTVILTPGRYNAAYFEHSYLAEKTGAHLVNGSELRVEDDKLYYVTYNGKMERVFTTLRLYYKSYDMMIDEITDSYSEFCRMIDIPDVYGSKEVFQKNYPFDETNKKGELIGNIIDPLRGEILDEILSPVNGILFTIREYPIVDAGSLLGRLLNEEVLDR